MPGGASDGWLRLGSRLSGQVPSRSTMLLGRGRGAGPSSTPLLVPQESLQLAGDGLERQLGGVAPALCAFHSDAAGEIGTEVGEHARRQSFRGTSGGVAGLPQGADHALGRRPLAAQAVLLQLLQLRRKIVAGGQSPEARPETGYSSGGRLGRSPAASCPGLRRRLGADQRSPPCRRRKRRRSAARVIRSGGTKWGDRRRSIRPSGPWWCPAPAR